MSGGSNTFNKSLTTCETFLGGINMFNNPYRCSDKVLIDRLFKINKAYVIIKSDISDYIKGEELLKLYKSSEDFRRSYSLLIKYGTKDYRLYISREALDNYDLIYRKFKEYERKDIIGNINYLNRVSDYINNYKYAKFVINHYIESNISYKETDFLSDLGIEKEVFNFCVLTIKELDLELYQKYLYKKEYNKRVRFVRNVEVIKDLANGINTGILKDCTPFDLLEFMRRIPFKKEKDFILKLIEFMKRNTPKEFDTIINYINKNKLYLESAWAPLDLDSIYSNVKVIRGVKITRYDNDVILDYLKVNDIPITYLTYLLARKKYIDKDFTDRKVQIKKLKKFLDKGPDKTLIPSN